MSDISKSVVKKDHYDKMSGKALYLADLKFEGMYECAVLRSEVPHARISSIELPDLPEGYFAVGGGDVPYNKCHCIGDEQPVFSDEEVMHTGEPIMLITGPDKAVCKRLVSEIKVTYEELPAVTSLYDAKDAFEKYHYVKGDPDKAFKDADRVYSETFHTGYQEQGYIEPQGMVALYAPDEDKLTVYGSMQCPYYIHDAATRAFKKTGDKVRVVQTVTGGGFGGKEDYPSLIACEAMAAAMKSGHPVRLVHDRREDLAVTTKRHPSVLKYDVALDKDGNILAIRADISLDAGAYPGLSTVVLQRTVLAAIGMYNIPNVDVTGDIKKTNLVNNGAYRGFGGPQAFFAIETLMNHLAAEYHVAPLEYRRRFFIKKGDQTSTKGLFHFYVPTKEMVDKAEELSGYSRKYEEYSKPQTGRYRRGIGLSIFFHGGAFTGSGEKDIIKSVVRVVKYEDDTVELLVSNTDMGQGLKTTFSKIAAQALQIPYEQVTVQNPDTDRVPNSGPTVASRSIMIVGKLVERACLKLKSEWVPGKKCEVEEHYQHPEFMIPWDLDSFSGDAYPNYSYGLNVAEVEVDMLTGSTRLLGSCGVFDVGHVIDQTIMEGQAEGGMLQAFGYGTIEKLDTKDGRLLQASFTDYLMPTSMDTAPFKVAFVENPYEYGPYGAKGAGELTLDGGAAAIEAAIEQAAGVRLSKIPVTAEYLMSAICRAN